VVVSQAPTEPRKLESAVASAPNVDGRLTVVITN